MMFLKALTILLLIVLGNTHAVAQRSSLAEEGNREKKISEANVLDLLSKIRDVFNNRGSDAISSFYNFYADSDARFIKTTFLIDPDNPDNIVGNEGINLSRSEYIDYIIKILKNPSKYFYRQSDIQFKLGSKPTDALISFHADEIIMYDAPSSPGLERYEKMLTSSNCNMNVQLYGGGLKIMGLNCIEKVAKKTLEIPLNN